MEDDADSNLEKRLKQKEIDNEFVMVNKQKQRKKVRKTLE